MTIVRRVLRGGGARGRRARIRVEATRCHNGRAPRRIRRVVTGLPGR